MAAGFGVIVLAAVIPPLILIRYIYRLDKIEKEPTGLLKKLFFFGALSVVPVIILELAAEKFLQMCVSEEITYIFLENFLGVALMEEAGKYYFLNKKTWNSPEFNYRFDGIVYSVVVSMGFAALENLFYILDGGFGTAVARALTSIPGHCIFGIFMGVLYGLGKSRDLDGDRRGCRRLKLLSVAVPMILHGFYDFILSVEFEGNGIIFFAYLIILDVTAFIMVKKLSARDRPV